MNRTTLCRLALLLALTSLGPLSRDTFAQLPGQSGWAAESSSADWGEIAGGRPEDLMDPAGRRQIIIGPPLSRFTPGGEVWVQPNLSIADAASDFEPIHLGRPEQGIEGLPPGAAPLPGPMLSAPDQPLETIPPPTGPTAVAEPMFENFVERVEQIVPASRYGHRGSFFRRLIGVNRPTGEIGIGNERVMFALFQLDISQPTNRLRIRLDQAWDVEFPRRSEYMWSGARGPKKVETHVNYQEVRFLHELGSPTFSVGTEIPIRAIDPTANDGTAGMGDMSLTTKTVIVDGQTWQFTQLFRTFFPTGSVTHGTGRGFVSMEAGFNGHYRYNDATFLHGQILYWFPLGADPVHSGTILRYGLGVSRLWLDTDRLALIPTFEIEGWNFLDGQKTVVTYEFNGDTQTIRPVGTTTHFENDFVLNVHPGMRIVLDTDSDLGLWEFGVSGGLRVTSRHFFKSALNLEMQYSW